MPLVTLMDEGWWFSGVRYGAIVAARALRRRGGGRSQARCRFVQASHDRLGCHDARRGGIIMTQAIGSGSVAGFERVTQISYHGWTM